jgi:hypothetical protein
MPFEPFYHRNPTKPFAQYSPGDTLYVVVKGDGLTEAELATAYQDYIKWISEPLGGVGLTFIFNRHPFTVPAGGTLFRVTFKKTGSHGARQTNSTTYDITHNAQELKDKKFGAQVCLHEFLHILGVPHELHNPLVHFCLKPNWEKILQWESVRDAKVKALRSQNKPEDTERADWLAWHASQGLKDFYYCLRWTLFSDDTTISYQFDPYHAAGGSVDLFHLYMDKIPGTEDIYTDKGIVLDTDRLMTDSLRTFLKSRFTTQKVTTSLSGRKKWFLNAQGAYDPRTFLPDEYLRRMTYKNPFMQQLIDDDYGCVEDLQWFKYETMHRYIGLSGTDPDTRDRCARQFPYGGCDPFSHDNFLNIWNKETQKFSICPVWANSLLAYCAAPQSQSKSQLPIPTTKSQLPITPEQSQSQSQSQTQTQTQTQTQAPVTRRSQSQPTITTQQQSQPQTQSSPTEGPNWTLIVGVIGGVLLLLALFILLISHASGAR